MVSFRKSGQLHERVRKKRRPDCSVIAGYALSCNRILLLFFPRLAIILAYVPAILYTHDDFLIIDKPNGLAVQGGAGVKTSLVGLLETEYGFKPWLVHRLDMDTSGCIVVARSPRSASSLSRLLTGNAVQKTYAALVVGEVPGTLTVIDSPVRAQGKLFDARTRVQKLWYGGGFSLLACTLETGRMHQIRQHCADAGFPIVGDVKYGNFKANRDFARKFGAKELFLHSWTLALPAPYNARAEAPLPHQFIDFFTALGKDGIPVPVDCSAARFHSEEPIHG